MNPLAQYALSAHLTQTTMANAPSAQSAPSGLGEQTAPPQAARTSMPSAIPLTVQCYHSLDTWEQQGTFDPMVGAETFKRWLRTSSYGVYVVVTVMFVVAFGIILGVLALLKPKFALKGDSHGLSWVKVIFLAIFLSFLVAMVAAMTQWIEAKSNEQRV